MNRTRALTRQPRPRCCARPRRLCSCTPVECAAYDDGLAVEVIRIRLGHLTAKQAEYGVEGEKKGDGYAILTIRVKNGTRRTVDLNGYATVTYGPDGHEATNSIVLYDNSTLSGKLLPGRNRSASYTYVVPDKDWGDVVMEFSVGDSAAGDSTDHDDSAVFAGSIK
jgi:hypothetical protein